MIWYVISGFETEPCRLLKSFQLFGKRCSCHLQDERGYYHQVRCSANDTAQTRNRVWYTTHQLQKYEGNWITNCRKGTSPKNSQYEFSPSWYSSVIEAIQLWSEFPDSDTEPLEWSYGVSRFLDCLTKRYAIDTVINVRIVIINCIGERLKAAVAYFTVLSKT
jgi:hypothetical protein